MELLQKEMCETKRLMRKKNRLTTNEERIISMLLSVIKHAGELLSNNRSSKAG